MAMLAEDYDYIIGGGPDRDTIDLAVLDTATGRVRTLPTRPMAPGTGGCWRGRVSTRPGGGSGRWRAPAASPPAWPCSSPKPGRPWWRSAP